MPMEPDGARAALPAWLPRSFRTSLEARPTLARVLGNVGWLVGERFATLAASFVITVWFVRYLGPERYGLFSYAVSLAAVFGIAADLGLDTIIVRELTRAPDADGEILGTTLFMRSAGALLAWAGAVVTVFLLRDDWVTRAMVTVLALGCFGVAANVFELWFQSRIAARKVVVARTAIFLVSALVRCALIVLAASLLPFAALQAATVLITASALFWLYRRARRVAKVRLAISGALARRMVADAWPLFVWHLSIILYMKIDQVMLTAMSGERENGIYAVAVTLSEVWYFLPVAVAATLFPLIVKAHDELDATEFEARMQAFYDGMAALGYAIAVPIMLLAGPIVRLLYGQEYERSASVLVVHAASFVFVCLGVARSRFLLAANLTRFTMFTGVFAALLNIGLNLVLIPPLGAYGAAWSTLVSYAVANYLTGFLYGGVRRQSWLVTRALVVPLRPRALVSMLTGWQPRTAPQIVLGVTEQRPPKP
ncbi:flippase [Anaeromyxobacter sp. Fw109-5]|uniref:flippase n=1 Tax=Anaeromyxobacter sp. (strain Fw109-5) TaxID=404589 RepID=UPI000158A6DE|nr:flippase [Anaeromyxobacter sp. Fw109-5]ABS25444.1 polysaccharide biosynthesis protein [Anaeromyxobacter sp. Fw109-5]